VTRTYRLYGLTIESELPLRGARATSGVRPDLVVMRGAPDRFDAAEAALRGADTASSWFECLDLPGGDRYLRWRGSFDFIVSGGGRRIWYRKHAHVPADSFGTYLLGQVLSFALLARGIEALHGTVSVVDGRAVAFVGDCGYGKSTLAAAMLRRGFPILTDDLIVLDERRESWFVRPGAPRLKLFPSVAKRLIGSNGSATPMNGGTAKLVLPLRPAQCCREPRPLTAIYVLDPPSGSRKAAASRGISLTQLSGAEGLIEVVRAAFNLLVDDRDRLARHFAFASRIASAIPLRRLEYTRTFRQLPAVCDAVLADLTV
jgi:hypothetical protein